VRVPAHPILFQKVSLFFFLTLSKSKKRRPNAYPNLEGLKTTIPNLQLQKIDQKAEKERDHETEKERQTECFLTADFFLRGFNEVGNFTMRNGRRNYFTVPTVTKFTKGSSSGAQLPDSGDVHFRIPPPRHCQDHVANMSGCQALERRLFSVFCFAFDLKFDQSLEMIPQ
jgi:hypothetical protein